MHSVEITPLGKKFSVLTKLYVGALTERLKEMDIERHFYVLYRISLCNSSVSQKCLGEILGHDKTNMVRIVDYLADRGYVLRVQNPNDRREHFIELTKKAKAQIPKIESAFREVNASAFSGLSPIEMEQFHFLISKLEVNLSELPSRPVHIDFKPKK